MRQRIQNVAGNCLPGFSGQGCRFRLRQIMRAAVFACLCLGLLGALCACANIAPTASGGPGSTQDGTGASRPASAYQNPSEKGASSPQAKAAAGEAVGMDAGEVYAADSYWEGEEGPEWQDPFNTEEYSSLDEGGFVSTSTRPLSTLSADVDTASYCNLRRMVNDGYYAEEIPSGAIRIEEMLNYFNYDYALPEGDSLFGTTVRVADCPWNPQTKLLVMGFATQPERYDAAKGSNLVFLIDVSGSMDSPDKLALLQDAFGVLVDQLGEQDRVSIVTYASGEEVVLEGARGSEGRKIMRAIKRLHANGSTNGQAGLRMAYEIAQDNFIEGGVNRIILASDGDLNVGMTDESSLEDYVSKQRKTGIYLSVLGFGSGNYKDSKMETLADHGNGAYHYIDCIAQAQRVFGEKLTANLVPLADDVKLQIEFNPATVKGYRLIGYENRALADEDFRDDAKDAGDVGPGHQFTVAYELALADSGQEVNATELKYGGKQASGGAAVDTAVDTAADTATDTAVDTASEWLTCTMRYRLAADETYAEQDFVVDASALDAAPGKDWQFAAAVIEAGMVLRESEYANGATLEDALGLLEAADAESDSLRAEFADLVEQLARH